MENTPLTCIGCGRGLVAPAVGPRPKRCEDCNRIKRRTTRADIVCADCSETFTPKATGRIPTRCPRCAEDHRSRTNTDRVATWVNENRERNREYQRQYQAEWRKANPELSQAYSQRYLDKKRQDPEYLQQRRDRALKYAYGLTRGQVDAMRAAQNDLCAICQQAHVGSGTRLHVDHNHDTGAIRALLCGKCNTLIGLANDSPARLEQAAAYLRLHGAT